MSPLVVAAAVLAALAAALGLPPGARWGVRITMGRPREPGPSAGRHVPPGRPARAGGAAAGAGTGAAEGGSWAGPLAVTSAGTVRAVSVLAGGAAWLLLGGVLGAALGMGAAVVLPVVIARLEPARVRRERLELIRSAPLVADLLSAALMAGVPTEHAIPVVARAIGGPAGDCLMGVHRRTQLGEPVDRAWEGLVQTPGLGAVARAVARSSRTGAPLASLLAQGAEDLRAHASAAALVEVRATAVRAVLPLGLCLLPAFALLGIAPIVGGLLPSL